MLEYLIFDIKEFYYGWTLTLGRYQTQKGPR